MLSYNQIRDISKMFDPSINISLYEHNIDLEDDMDWNYNELNYPLSEFYTTVDEQFDFSRNTMTMNRCRRKVKFATTIVCGPAAARHIQTNAI